MAKTREVADLLERIDIIERKVRILEEKMDEQKRFTFDEMRQALLRIMSIEDSVSKLESRQQTHR